MSTEIYDGGPAFPVGAENGLGHVSDGMSLRDYFAAKIAQGQAALPDNRTWSSNNGVTLEAWRDTLLKADAAHCYRMADALLDERERNHEKQI